MNFEEPNHVLENNDDDDDEWFQNSFLSYHNLFTTE